MGFGFWLGCGSRFGRAGTGAALGSELLAQLRAEVGGAAGAGGALVAQRGETLPPPRPGARLLARRLLRRTRLDDLVRVGAWGWG